MSVTKDTESVSVEQDTRRAEVINGLRALADFLESHPAVPYPVCTRLNAFVATRDELAAVARHGAPWAKQSNEQYFWLSRVFAGDPRYPDLQLDINIDREQVCRKVVKGTKTIPAQPERTIEDVEWICDEALLASEATS